MKLTVTSKSKMANHVCSQGRHARYVLFLFQVFFPIPFPFGFFRMTFGIKNTKVRTLQHVPNQK